MRVSLSLGIFVSSLFLVGCGAEAPHRELTEKSIKASQESAAKADMPKLMIARVATDDLDADSAKVEVRTITDDVKISSYDDAARAFEKGQSLHVAADGSASLAENKTAQVNLGAPVQAPVQAPVATKGAPCADPCTGTVVQEGKSSRGFFQVGNGGLFSGFRGFFNRLRPRVLCGCGDVGYNHAGDYSSKKYQYSVYQQAPGKAQNIPGQVAVPTQAPAPTTSTPGYGPTPVVYYPGGTTTGSTPSTTTPTTTSGGTGGGRLN